MVAGHCHLYASFENSSSSLPGIEALTSFPKAQCLRLVKMTDAITTPTPTMKAAPMAAIEPVKLD
jgi:hypothetical protein